MSDYLYGWKALANYYQITVRTLMNWHKQKPIPWEKRGPKKNDKVRISKDRASEYFFK